MLHSPRIWLLAALLVFVSPALSSAKPRIVVVLSTHPPRYPLVLAGRETWRQGVRTLIVTEGATERPVQSPLGDVPFETWWEYPDDLRKDVGVYKKGDMKFAASYRIANETFGDSYDWIAIGDDDTVWFLPAAEALVSGLDPNVPYILADVVSFCSPGAHCKKDKVCSLPRNAPAAGDAPLSSSTCVRSPAVEPCTVAALKAPGTCDVPLPWYTFPFPCGRNGALISRGMMRVLSASQWRERCELPNKLRGGGELRVYNCLWEAGYAMTDPTPGDDNTSCVMGFLGPAALMATAKAAVASNGTCDAACDHQLHRTVSLSVDEAGASPGFVRELHATVAAAKAAVGARVALSERDTLQADAAKLAQAMAAADFAPGAGLVTTLTTANKQRWRLFVNWLAHAAPLRLPLLIFVSDAHAAVACDAALDAARAALIGAPAAPMLCFYASATLGHFDMAPGADDYKDAFWLMVTNVAKPMSLALATGTGGDVVFVETDVVLRGDVLALLRARPDTVTMTCAAQSHVRGTFPLPGGNAGVLYFRADARVPPLLQQLAAECSARWESTDDQGALIRMMEKASLNATADAPFVFDCVDASDGFTTGCGAVEPAKGIAVHAACIAHTEAKVEWLRSIGLWIDLQESPPPLAPPLPAPLPPVPPPPALVPAVLPPAQLAGGLPEALQADAAKLAQAMAAAGFAPGAGLVATLTTPNTHRWRLFINWLAHAAPLRLPLLIFVSEARAAAACDAALDAARAALIGAPAAPMLCFYASATLGRFDMAPGQDSYGDLFWRRVTNIAKSMAVALAAGAGGDVVFAETDVVLRGDVLALLRARPDTVTMTCATHSHSRGIFPLPHGNAGVLYFRADARVPPLLRQLAVECGTNWENTDSKAALIATMQAASLNATAGTLFVFDCVDTSDGFTTGCAGSEPEKGVAVHAACVPRTEGKVEWLTAHGLWIHPNEQ